MVSGLHIGFTQEPETHAPPVEHLVVQLPQWFWSLCVSKQPSEQTMPVVHMQVPLLHTCPLPQLIFAHASVALPPMLLLAPPMLLLAPPMLLLAPLAPGDEPPEETLGPPPVVPPLATGAPPLGVGAPPKPTPPLALRLPPAGAAPPPLAGGVPSGPELQARSPRDRPAKRISALHRKMD
ncbi:MAG: hypothetical protein ABI335_16275 [Polyangiaceae bacterium]